MKTSKYNYFIPYTNNTYIVFNGITKRFFQISKAYIKPLKHILENPKEYMGELEYKNILQKMKNNGFLIDYNTEELKKIQSEYYSEINQPNYELMILPTYNCNFSCWYCVQHHRNEYMNIDIENRTKAHISRYLIENKIKSFTIAWFGGEPLLAFDCIERISKYAKLECQKLHIPFHCTITTNGSLLTEEIIYKMKDLFFDDFQITLDGNKEKHNKTRYNKNCPDSFCVILYNIIKILKIIPNVNLTLRYNYTAENLNHNIINQINSIIPFELRRFIRILPRKVWQEDEERIPIENLRDLFRCFKNSGYNIEHHVDVFHRCYVENRHFNTIFHNGKVDKCSNIDIVQARGELLKDGIIKWTATPIFDTNNIYTLNSICKRCRFVPICKGPCPSRRERMLEENSNITCIWKNKTKANYNTILNYCDVELNQQLI